jgi:hypothetical protein
MRLDALEAHQMDLDLYVLADTQVSIEQLQTQYAGPVKDLRRPPPADVRRLFRAPYLTRMHSVINPTTLTADFVARSVPVSETVKKDDSGDFPLLVIVLVAIPLLALTGFGVWLTRRVRGEPPG